MFGGVADRLPGGSDQGTKPVIETPVPGSDQLHLQPEAGLRLGADLLQRSPKRGVGITGPEEPGAELLSPPPPGTRR
jgi:hypothetical protein